MREAVESAWRLIARPLYTYSSCSGLTGRKPGPVWSLYAHTPRVQGWPAANQGPFEAFIHTRTPRVQGWPAANQGPFEAFIHTRTPRVQGWPAANQGPFEAFIHTLLVFRADRPQTRARLKAVCTRDICMDYYICNVLCRFRCLYQVSCCCFCFALKSWKSRRRRNIGRRRKKKRGRKKWKPIGEWRKRRRKSRRRKRSRRKRRRRKRRRKRRRRQTKYKIYKDIYLRMTFTCTQEFVLVTIQNPCVSVLK